MMMDVFAWGVGGAVACWLGGCSDACVLAWEASTYIWFPIESLASSSNLGCFLASTLLFLPFLGVTHTGFSLFEDLFVVISCPLGLELGFQVRFSPLIQGFKFVFSLNPGMF
ncbi:hypothetical protein V6N12_023967 [Hibiscus sabdariffa]|uniref:Secreted protein n=1 Tax=Hibiscus sabdariffa TaxID=183260 RepID=A0ABR2G031_9ROSI